MGSFITSQESYSISRRIKLDWIYNFEFNGILADYLRGVNGYEKHARGKSRGLL